MTLLSLESSTGANTWSVRRRRRAPSPLKSTETDRTPESDRRYREREREKGDSAAKREILEVALPGCRRVAFRLKRDHWGIAVAGLGCICGPHVLE